MVEKENTQGLEIQGNEVRILTDNHSLENELDLFLFDGGFLCTIWGHWQMENVVGLSFFLYRMRSTIQKYLLMKKIYQNIDSFLWKCHAGVFKIFF